MDIMQDAYPWDEQAEEILKDYTRMMEAARQKEEEVRALGRMFEGEKGISKATMIEWVPAPETPSPSPVYTITEDSTSATSTSGEYTMDLIDASTTTTSTHTAVTSGGVWTWGAVGDSSTAGTFSPTPPAGALGAMPSPKLKRTELEAMPAEKFEKLKRLLW